MYTCSPESEIKQQKKWKYHDDDGRDCHIVIKICTFEKNVIANTKRDDFQMEWTHRKKSHYCCHCWQMIKRTLTRHQAALAICCFILFLLFTKQQLLYVSIKFQFLWFPPRFFFPLSIFQPTSQWMLMMPTAEKKKYFLWKHLDRIRLCVSLSFISRM